MCALLEKFPIVERERVERKCGLIYVAWVIELLFFGGSCPRRWKLGYFLVVLEGVGFFFIVNVLFGWVKLLCLSVLDFRKVRL